MAVSATIAVVGAISTGVSAYGAAKTRSAQAKRAREVTSANRRAEALQKRRDDIVAARSRARSRQETTRAKGFAINRAGQAGTGGAIGAAGSTVPGVVGSLSQQFASGVAFQNQITDVNAGIRTAFGDARDLKATPISSTGANIAAAGAAFGAIAGGYASSKRGAAAIEKLFG
jgi:hypothetical protein